MENSFLQPLGHIELGLPDAPEKAARPPPQPVDPYSGYGPKAEISHIFRSPEKRPPQELSIAFMALVLLPFVGFLAGLIHLRVNIKNFPKSTVAATYASLFHLGIAVLILYAIFWTRLDLFTTLTGNILVVRWSQDTIPSRIYIGQVEIFVKVVKSNLDGFKADAAAQKQNWAWDS